MPRNISFMLTTPQYINRTKIVTRRLGWAFLKPGDILNGVEKAQGLKKGEKIVRLGQHRVFSTEWEPLDRMLWEPAYGRSEVVKEGFPEMTPAEFVEFFCRHNKCRQDTMINRIEFEYIGQANCPED